MPNNKQIYGKNHIAVNTSDILLCFLKKIKNPDNITIATILQYTAISYNIMVLFSVNLHYTIPQNKPVRPLIMRIDPIHGVAPESRTVETG